MKKAIIVIAFILATFAFSTYRAKAEIVVVDPDQFPDGTEISTSFPGVTLSAVAFSDIGSFDPVYSRDSSFASTGFRVFSWAPDNPEPSWYSCTYCGWTNRSNPFRANFDIPTDYVAIDMIANDWPDYGVLKAYDSYDNLLASYTTEALYAGTVNDRETAVISRPNPDIAYILAAGSASTGDSILLDRLQFGSGPKPIDIDIKPDSDDNCINNNGHGVIPVAILGSADFDSTQVDPLTCSLEGQDVRVVGKSDKLLAHIEDVNGDGFNDLVLQIEDVDGSFQEGQGEATLTCNLYEEYGSIPIEGTDSICIVP